MHVCLMTVYLEERSHSHARADHGLHHAVSREPIHLFISKNKQRAKKKQKNIVNIN